LIGRRPLIVALRLLAVWAAESAGLLLAAWALPGVEVGDPAEAVAAVALISVLNAVLYPVVLSRLASIAAATFGLLALLMNAGLVLLAAQLDTGLSVDGLGAAFVLVFVLTGVNAFVTGLLAIDDEGSFYRGVVLRQARRAEQRAGAADGTPGVLFLEIDGLSEQVLRQALDGGWMPHLAGWLESGSHRVTPWECDLSSQTSASQSGLLLGTNEGIPAFRWFDRAEGRPVVSSKPDDAALIERRGSSGDGLLVGDGASRGNLLTGDAPHVTLTLSAVREHRADRKDRADAWRSFLTNPYSMPRTLLMFIADALAEKRAARRQRRADVRPRIDRGGSYPLIRAATTSFLIDATVSMLIGDIFRGTPAAYATFVAYDEVAHHSGIAAPDALAMLTRLDTAFARLERATRLAPRPYHLVVLSDHGQSQGATFKQRYGKALEEVVDDLCGDPVQGGGGTEEEALDQLGLALGEAGEAGPRGAEAVAGRFSKSVEKERPPVEARSGDEVLVFASGNLGLIYLTALKEPPTLEQIEAAHPGLVEGLARHDGIGFVAGRSGARGPVVIGGGGERELESGAVSGEDPLAPFGERAADHVRRELGFGNAPDLLLNSTWYPEAGEVAAFEELVGSHGGIGGPQSHPFLLHPAILPAPAEPLVGAAAVHRVLKSWLIGRAGATAPRAAGP
jgi:uncharacterized membrane protein YvlD (DUF360 family)